MPLEFWGQYLDDHVRRIVDAAFITGRKIADENHVDAIAAVRAAGDVAESAVRTTIDKMVDYDRRMRGNGFPQSVPKKDTSLELERSLKSITTRRDAEIALLSGSAKDPAQQSMSQSASSDVHGGSVQIRSGRDVIISDSNIRGGDVVETGEKLGRKNGPLFAWIIVVAAGIVAGLAVAYLKGCFPNLLK